MGAILGPAYAEEQAALLDDPIIARMAQDLHDHLVRAHGSLSDMVHDEDPEQMVFTYMNNISRGYHSLGGSRATSIGGPAKAILTYMHAHGLAV